MNRKAKILIAQQKEELEATLEELKKAQQKIIQSEKLASLGVFIAGIAHEINNPINFINMGVDSFENILNKVLALFIEINKLTVGSSSEEIQSLLDLKAKLKIQRSIDAAPETLENIRIGIRRTLSITEGLRTYTRINTESKTLNDINKIIDTALILLKPKLNSQIAIIKNYGDLSPIMVFAGKLNQVFVNILSNSIDAIVNMHKQIDRPSVTITTSEKPEFITVKISDTGTGIPDHILANIFDPFFTTKEVGKGTGLGMSISMNIIEEHRGTITARNNQDKGVTFTIEIPRVNL
jgi:C4-dicarboxylate-specific signal transduction histidine kinase